MKKIQTFFLLMGCLIVVTACGNRQKIDDEKMTPQQRKAFTQQFEAALEEATELVGPNETQVTVTTQATKEKVQLAEKLLATFNRSSLNFSGEINEVTTAEGTDTHQEIVIRAMERYTKKEYEQSQKAIEAGTATTAELATIYEIQQMVEEAAKFLENEIDVIKVVYPDSNNEDIAIAVANKNGSLLPLVK